jgi:hypothetical protein
MKTPGRRGRKKSMRILEMSSCSTWTSSLCENGMDGGFVVLGPTGRVNSAKESFISFWGLVWRELSDEILK